MNPTRNHDLNGRLALVTGAGQGSSLITGAVINADGGYTCIRTMDEKKPAALRRRLLSCPAVESHTR